MQKASVGNKSFTARAQGTRSSQCLTPERKRAVSWQELTDRMSKSLSSPMVRISAAGFNDVMCSSSQFFGYLSGKGVVEENGAGVLGLGRKLAGNRLSEGAQSVQWYKRHSCHSVLPVGQCTMMRA